VQAFHKIDPQALQLETSVFDLIGKEWMLITAGEIDDFNTMTASWGGLGYLWNLPVSFCFVRPQRHTYGFMERSSFYTLSFYAEAYRDVLQFCGTHSGRNVDKVAETGVTPLADDSGAVYFAEARRVLVCRKLYAQDLTGEGFVDHDIRDQVYAAEDYHRVYVGEVVRVLARPAS
jgi:flavin reductase (DIM6/NTAB) family NADH-FMN oxidoreductase RutF